MLKPVLAFAALALAIGPGAAFAQSTVKVGTLECDVSAGVGMFLVQKQTMKCLFKTDDGKSEAYTGKIDEYGVAIGKVEAGQLIWGVIAPAKGLPKGALAGSYGGVGAEATVGAGLGANVLVGGTGRAFSLQPLSVEGQTGINIAAGVTTVTLAPAP
jgi:hypothetical protein